MKRKIILFFIVFPILVFSQKKDSEGLRLYNLGVEYFKENKIKEADSCFTKSVELEFFLNTYYNLAMCKKKLNDMEKYCYYVEILRYWNDQESKNLFDSECIRVDSFFVDSNMRKADASSYVFKIKYISSNYTPTREFIKSDREGKVSLKYRMSETDTIYWILPDETEVKELKDQFLIKINKSIIYPKYERRNNISGMVSLSFNVDKKGNISNIVKRGSYFEGFGLEAERVINLIGNFGIVKFENKSINYRITLPINFKLK